MDDQQVGNAFRTIRIRKRWRQDDLSAKAGVSRTMIGRIEHGHVASVPVGTVRKVAAALDARFDTVVRWQGGDLARLINARHAAMHEAMARMFASFEGWIAEPEVSFSIFGERGVIDILAWHPVERVLLVIELKTEIVDVNELMGSVDPQTTARRRGRSRPRLGPGRDRDVVVGSDNRTNRRALAVHETVLRSKFPVDGRAIRTWLREPDGRVDALSFLPSVHAAGVRRELAPVRRVAGARPKRPNA